MMRSGHSLIAVWVAVFFVALSANADLVFYTDRNTWETAANAPITTETFNEVTPYEFSEGMNPAGLITIELVNYPSALSTQFNEINNGSGFRTIDGSRYYNGACYPETDSYNRIHLPEPVTALGGDFNSTYSSSGLRLELNGVSYEFSNLMDSGTGTGFLGFTSTEVFSSVTLFTLEKSPYYGESFGLDNISFVPLPEPLTISLFGLGVLCLDCRRRLFKN